MANEMESKSDSSGLAKEPFVRRVSLEMRRAERYRIFVSLVVLDLSFLKGRNGHDRSPLIEGILSTVAGNIRVIDEFALVGSHRLVVLMPETQRQGAEAAARRLSDIVKKDIEQRTQQSLDRMIPLEMASYPDAAGTRSISEMIQEIAQVESQN
jgi:GGDEF domain-containing protein